MFKAGRGLATPDSVLINKIKKKIVYLEISEKTSYVFLTGLFETKTCGLVLADK